MTKVDGSAIAAAIDIGSNSIKMTVGRPNGRGGIEQIAWASEVVRLGEGVDATGRLDELRMDAAIEALLRFREQARDLDVKRILAVATEATRAAANGVDFLRRVTEETGIVVQLIDGEREAALTFHGLASELDLNGSAVIADIGGGSTELIAVADGDVAASLSALLGSGRLTERLVNHDPPTIDELDACEAAAANVVSDALKKLALPGQSIDRLVLVGGTPEYLARLLPNDRSVNEAAVRDVLAELTTIPASDVAERIGVPEARARVLPAGGAIVAAIVAQLKPAVIELAHSGVRAGLLLEAFSATTHPRGGRKGSSRKPGRSSETGRVSPDMEAETGGDAPADSDFGETMMALIAERWAAVWAAIPVALAGEDIEGVHDVRVASRRLRAAMDIAAPVFPKPWFRTLHRTAKEITGALGEVRDRDVLLQALAADRAKAPLVERPGIDRLIKRVERERVVARREMEAYLEALQGGRVRGEVERRFGSSGT